MKKRIAALLLAAALLLCGSAGMARSHKSDGDMHKDELQTALTYKIIQIDTLKEKNNMKYLQNACQIAIDQFNGNHSNALQELLKDRIPNIPSSISVIDLNAGGTNHRQYTHQGWTYNYKEYNDCKNEDWTDRWKKRKEIMLATAEHVFNFNGLPSFLDKILPYDERCKAFCALMYYIHVLGDHSRYDNYSAYRNGKNKIMPVAGRRSDTVLSEMRKYILILFDEQDCSRLLKRLQTAESELGSLINAPENLQESENFNRYKKLVQEILNEILPEELPQLLKNEAFFNKVFA